MRLYLDASALVASVVTEASSPIIDRLLLRAETAFEVSGLAVVEVSSAISRLYRMGVLSEQQARLRLEEFDIWLARDASLIQQNEADTQAANDFVRRFQLKLRAPDALHLAICQRREARLVTFDRRLATAAEALEIAVLV
ncbi:MAG: type II toxin-antitoxin system VapC family toxin, partial [Caulobacteraceae bacterium]